MFKPEITLPCFAKINLSLHILGKRPDSYHELVTVLQTVSLHDDLQLASREDQRVILSCDSAEVPADETNLILRAARMLQEKFGSSSGADIYLEKKIPIRGGLGGASSNAAVALLGLARLWQLDLSLDQLIGIGSELGSDVPFFFFGGRAVASGVGTVIRPITDTFSIELLIVAPKGGVSTAEAYSALKAHTLTSTETTSILAGSLVAQFLTKSDQWPLHNDFENVIFEKEPETLRVKNALLKAGARNVLLAGSGSSVFGIFDSTEAQQRALGEIQADVGWRIFPCRTISRDEYVRALGSCGTSLLRSSLAGLNSGA